MKLNSLGIIEVAGLLAAVEAADVVVKSANVQLIGYEMAKGGGWTTIKITGDVGAVKAAINAAEVSAKKMGTFVTSKVIARPAAGLISMVYNENTVGYTPETTEETAEDTVELQVEEVEEIVEVVEVAEETQPEEKDGNTPPAKGKGRAKK